jgi:hypothetical protein
VRQETATKPPFNLCTKRVEKCTYEKWESTDREFKMKGEKMMRENSLKIMILINGERRK